MGSLPFGPPHPVSPVIRGARFAFLFAGIIYGRIKLVAYRAAEKKWRSEEAKRKVSRDQHNAALKEQIANEEKNLFPQEQDNSSKNENESSAPKACLEPPPRAKPKPCEHDANRSKASVQERASKAKPCEYEPDFPERISRAEAIPNTSVNDTTEPFTVTTAEPSVEEGTLSKAILTPTTRTEFPDYAPDLPKPRLVPTLKPKPYDPSIASAPEVYIPPQNPYAKSYEDELDGRR